MRLVPRPYALCTVIAARPRYTWRAAAHLPDAHRPAHHRLGRPHFGCDKPLAASADLGRVSRLRRRRRRPASPRIRRVSPRRRARRSARFGLRAPFCRRARSPLASGSAGVASTRRRRRRWRRRTGRRRRRRPARRLPKNAVEVLVLVVVVRRARCHWRLSDARRPARRGAMTPRRPRSCLPRRARTVAPVRSMPPPRARGSGRRSPSESPVISINDRSSSEESRRSVT